jgi:PKD repeat protein
MPRIFLPDDDTTEHTSGWKLGTPIVVDNDDDILPTVWKPGFECIVPELTSIIADPEIGDFPLTVEFSATIVEGYTEPLTYLWNFGDGATSTEANPTHEFESADIFTVTLTITNECGSDNSSTEVEVTEPAPDIDTFVAVSSNGVLGDGQHAMTSPEGTTWTIRNTITTYDGAYRDIAYSPSLGRFVAVGLNNDLYMSTPGLLAQVITSDDGGITWIRREFVRTTYWLSAVEWSSALNLFVALSIGTEAGGSGDADRAFTSPDGITWTTRTAAQAVTWRDLAWAPSINLFAAIADTGTDRVMTSPDGITWTTRTPSADNEWNAICWSSALSLFVAVSDNGTDRVMTSPDGITWTARSAAAASTWLDVIWCAELNLFVAIAATGTTQIMTSPDGVTWTARTKPNANVWSALAFDGTTIVCVAQSGTGDRVMTSTDGITWTAGVSAADKSWVAVAYSR